MLLTTNKNRDVLEHKEFINRIIKQFFNDSFNINYEYNKVNNDIEIIINLSNGKDFTYEKIVLIPLESKMINSQINKIAIRRKVNVEVANIFHKFSLYKNLEI